MKNLADIARPSNSQPIFVASTSLNFDLGIYILQVENNSQSLQKEELNFAGNKPQI